MGRPSGPTPLCPAAATRPESVGAQAPPTKAMSRGSSRKPRLRLLPQAPAEASPASLGPKSLHKARGQGAVPAAGPSGPPLACQTAATHRTAPAQTPRPRLIRRPPPLSSVLSQSRPARRHSGAAGA
ncbi:DUF6053 domain-containing protein [Lysobacter enzymogenes]|uniref:DUF6053 domain-containing protein n=1 Tax=Lysobacter enzymogenes TaxID=69 RepID=UPI003747CE9A